MTFATATTGYLNDIVLGLTPLQRLDAVKKHHSNTGDNEQFIVYGSMIIALLIVLLLVRLYCRKRSSQKSKRMEVNEAIRKGQAKIAENLKTGDLMPEDPADQVFAEYANAKDLTGHEYQILLEIATHAKLKRKESIFTLPSAFDRTVSRMLETIRTEQGIEESRQLEADLSLLCEKLGFQKFIASNENSATEMTTQSTQDIPLKKKIYIRRRHRNHDNLEATVIKNTPDELIVEFRNPVEIVFGQPWICRYYQGTFVAEFYTTAIKCSGQIVALEHSDNVRMINRRRFLRVPVKIPAYVAKFPFRKNLSMTIGQPRKKVTDINPSNQMDNDFRPPHFIPTTVTELGGPGLRIKTDLDVNIGDRVILVFKLDPVQIPEASNRNRHAKRIIEDIACVRHVTTKESGSSVALELTGLNDDGINELIRATNEVSISMSKRRRIYAESDIRNKRTAELVSV